jgi:hypothetical protein
MTKLPRFILNQNGRKNLNEPFQMWIGWTFVKPIGALRAQASGGNLCGKIWFDFHHSKNKATKEGFARVWALLEGVWKHPGEPFPRMGKISIHQSTAIYLFSIQFRISNFFEIDYFHKKKRSILSHCNLEAIMPRCTCPFTFVHVIIITFMLEV